MDFKRAAHAGRGFGDLLRGLFFRAFPHQVGRQTGDTGAAGAFVDFSGIDGQADGRLRNNSIRHQGDLQTVRQRVGFVRRNGERFWRATLGWRLLLR